MKKIIALIAMLLLMAVPALAYKSFVTVEVTDVDVKNTAGDCTGIGGSSGAITVTGSCTGCNVAASTNLALLKEGGAITSGVCECTEGGQGTISLLLNDLAQATYVAGYNYATNVCSFSSTLSNYNYGWSLTGCTCAGKSLMMEYGVTSKTFTFNYLS